MSRDGRIAGLGVLLADAVEFRLGELIDDRASYTGRMAR